ncbi:MAG: GNAT family N-acetyltransferase [Planctomycetales bacterium]|nr:GNAT family N-acetyltransferase [Planctomycetales bacterium]
MAGIEVVPVESRRQRKDFLNLPRRIYAQDPHWIPPLNANIKEMVNFVKHPFYKAAALQTFVAYRGTEVVGRIAAIDNPGHRERYGENLGFWGFLETIDDADVVQTLFDAVRNWFKARGIEQLRGPVNPSLNYECGLLVEGFDSSPTFMMTYNPPYYGPLVEQAGFAKCQDLFAFWGHVRMLKELDKKLDFVVTEATRRFNVTTRRLDRSRFNQEVRMFLDIYNKSLVNTWGFVPLSDAELDHLAGSLKYLIVPEMTSIAEVDGKPIGAMFGLLDYNPRIREINGRLFPFGFLKLLRNRRGIKKVRLVSTNVLPEYQKWGIGLVLVSRIVPDVLEWGIEEAEFSWVLETNHLSRSTLERGGAILQKRYRIYDSV